MSHRIQIEGLEETDAWGTEIVGFKPNQEVFTLAFY